MKEIVYTPHNEQTVLSDFDIGTTLNNNRSTPVLSRPTLSSTEIQPYQKIFSGATTPESIEISEVTEETPAETVPVQSVSPTVTHRGGKHNVSAQLQGVLDIFDKYGIGYNVTSGHRPGATTAQGRQSFHATGHAMDITPKGMTYDDWKERIRNTPEIQEYFRNNNLGILDETTPEMLKRTGGTGAHWHIGPDQIAVKTFKEWYGKQGGKILDIRKLQPGGAITYQTHKQSNAKNPNKFTVPLGSADLPSRGYVPQYNVRQDPETHMVSTSVSQYIPGNLVESGEVLDNKSEKFNNVKQRIGAKGQNWTDEEISRLIDTFDGHDFDLDHIVTLIESESGFNPTATNKSSTATGLFQFIQSTAKDILGEEVAKEYANNSRSIIDQIQDGKTMIDKINDNISSERDKLTFGRLKVNMMSPNHSLNKIIPDSVWQHSLSPAIMKRLQKGKSTYRDLMNLYDSGFKN